MTDFHSVEVPCRIDPEHGTHYAYVRDELPGRSVLEVFDIGSNEGEVAGIYRAVFRALVDWDLHDANGDKLQLTQQNVDELHLEQFNALRPDAVKALKKGNEPLPNASGGRSPSTSSGNRSRSPRKKG